MVLTNETKLLFFFFFLYFKDLRNIFKNINKSFSRPVWVSIHYHRRKQGDPWTFMLAVKAGEFEEHINQKSDYDQLTACSLRHCPILLINTVLCQTIAHKPALPSVSSQNSTAQPVKYIWSSARAQIHHRTHQRGGERVNRSEMREDHSHAAASVISKASYTTKANTTGDPFSFCFMI